MSEEIKPSYIELEAKWKTYWEERRVYAFDREGADDSKPGFFEDPKPGFRNKETFSIDTPPPYVSGDYIHMGHAMSYVQADMAARYKRLCGFNVLYPMGFDDNGLPTERFIEKKFNIDKSRITRAEFRELCMKETAEGGAKFAQAFKDVALSCDFTLYPPLGYYSTISPYAQKISQISFLDLFAKDAVIEREEPFLYCPVSQTAVAFEDLEDLERESFMNYVNFTFDDGTPAQIATTRPELIPAVVGIFHHPSDTRFKDKKSVTIPLFNYEVGIYADESVDPEKGTGLMMVSTFGDKEDVAKWKKHKLPLRALIGLDGRLGELAGKYQGMKIEAARTAIIEDLKESGFLVKQDKITHTVNVYERTKAPVEFVLTKQWFVKTVEIKDKLLEMGAKLAWYPPELKNVFDNWVNGLEWDWCISRQRFFGVPIPVWYCNKTGDPYVPEIHELPVDPTSDPIPQSIIDKAGHSDLRGTVDVLDTWFTSSVSPQIAAGWEGGDIYNMTQMPLSMRPQAFEIIRTWLFYTMVKSYYHSGELPWKTTMISGHALDGKGQKMSKSLGNVVDPREVLKAWGADVMRFWASGCTLGQSLRYNEEELRIGKRLITKITNVAALLKMFIEGENSVIPAQAGIHQKGVLDGSPDFRFASSEDDSQLNPLHKSIYARFSETLATYKKYFDDYEYSLARQTVDTFFWHDFCDNYVEIMKHPVYQNDNKEEFLSVAFDLFKKILILYSPIIPFITEELYHNLYLKPMMGEDAYDKAMEDESFKTSIHTESLPTDTSSESIELWTATKDVIMQVRKAKSDQGLSIAKELDTVEVTSAFAFDDLTLDLIKKTVKVGEIQLKS